MESKTIAGKAQPLGLYPHIKRVGDYIFVSGTSSRRPDNTHDGATLEANGKWQLDIKLQTKAVIENIASLISTMDASLEDVVDITTFLVDMKDFKGYNQVYGEYFNANGPTRTTVAVHQLPHPNLLIEIKALVYKPL